MPTPAPPAVHVSRSVPRGTDVIVVGFDGSGAVGVPEAIETAYTKRVGMGVGTLALQVGAKPASGTPVVLPAVGDGPRVVVVGVGEGELSPEALRRAAGAGLRRAGELAAEASLSVAVSLGTDDPEALRAIAEGALLGSYRYAPISAQPTTGGIDSVTVVSAAAGRAGQLAAEVSAVTRAVLAAREWVNVPPNLLYPATFADEARQLCLGSRVAVEVLDEKALAKGGYGGLLAVGGGSMRPPRLVQLRYTPRGAKAHLALVGKGITFDSGGLNLKPADGMYTMKCDMAGAAVVLAATYAIAALGLKVKVTTYGALAENLPSDTAYRPSDVLTIYGGTTVENGNTDAEGRLVLADALARASEDGPDLLVDVATLTGACVIALGDRIAGLMTNDDRTADCVLDAAEAAGEDVWHLPLPRELRSRLDSKVADLRSTAASNRSGGALIAATFLRQFVGEGISWAHLDIAGPAFNDGAPFGHVPSGGTGFGVRTLVALARALQG